MKLCGVEAGNHLLERYGYISVMSPYDEVEVGAIVPSFRSSTGQFAYPMVVTGRSSATEFIEQSKECGNAVDSLPGDAFFYRVTAE